MKVFYIANIRLPTEKAHGVQIMKMCEAFAVHGHEVTLVVPCRFNHIKEDSFKYYNTKSNFKIKKLPTVDLIFLGRAGFWIQSISFSVFVLIYALFKKEDFIYSRDELPLLLLSFLKKNIIWEVHMPRYRIVAQLLLKRIDKIVAISQGLKDFYVKKGVLPEHIFVAHDGVDLDDFAIVAQKEEVRSSLNIPNDKPVIMYIGRLDKWKGVDVLLKASESLKDAHVVVIGEGEELERFKMEYKDVVFLGLLPYRDLAYNQQAADVLIIPNSGKSKISRLYTSPLKVFAHMTSGIPIVASDLPSLREVLSEQNAMLVESNNVNSFTNGIQSVIRENSKALQRAKKAQEDVRQYSWNKRVQGIINYIKA